MAELKMVDNHWQTTKANVRERNEFMFNNELLSDIKFQVGKQGDNLKILCGHKYVLATASPVFFAMLFGDLAECGDTIEIKDCEPDSFAEFLRYVYCDQANLNPSNVLGILYLAKKYIIPFLVKECVNYLMENVTVNNLLEVLQAARCFSEGRLERHCWSILSRETWKTFQSDSFLEIDAQLLASILEKDGLNINEIEVFKAIKKWVERKLSRDNAELTTENKRRALDEIIHLIRFPVMSAKEFAEGPARSELLPIEDVKDIFVYLNAGIIEKSCSTKYSFCPRNFKPSVCARYNKTMKNYLWRYDEHDIDAIRFKVDDEVYLAGVGLYGSPCGGEYNVVMTITDDNDFVYKKDTTFTCPPDPDFHSVDNPMIYQIMFDEPIRIKENAYYSICILLEGPPSYAGDDGRAEVVTEGVQFQFENCGESTNGTSFDEGQIPTLLFYF